MPGPTLRAALPAAGAEVVIAGRRLEALRGGGRCVRRRGRWQADVTDEASVEAMFAAAGPCDIVIANAGAADSARRSTDHAGPVERDDRGQPDRGVPDLARGAAADAGWGRLISVASTAGLKGYAKVAPYAAAKHGVVGLTRSLALEIARKGRSRSTRSVRGFWIRR